MNLFPNSNQRFFVQKEDLLCLLYHCKTSSKMVNREAIDAGLMNIPILPGFFKKNNLIRKADFFVFLT